MVLAESNLTSEDPLTHLQCKMHFGTEASGLNSEGDLNFGWSL